MAKSLQAHLRKGNFEFYERNPRMLPRMYTPTRLDVERDAKSQPDPRPKPRRARAPGRGRGRGYAAAAPGAAASAKNSDTVLLKQAACVQRVHMQHHRRKRHRTVQLQLFVCNSMFS